MDYEIVPALEDVCREVGTETGCRVHVRGQWDNAGPHKEKNLMKHIDTVFGERGWVFTTQPPNTPLSNIKDKAIFLSMAKKASATQG